MKIKKKDVKKAIQKLLMIQEYTMASELRTKYNMSTYTENSAEEFAVSEDFDPGKNPFGKRDIGKTE